MAKKLQSPEVEECKECYIEILNTGTFLEQFATEADALTPLAPGSSPSDPGHVPIQVDYCPQSALMPLAGPVPQLVAPLASSNTTFSQRGEDG